MRILRISRQLQKSFTDFNQGDISILLSYYNTLYTDKTIEDDIDFSIVSETEMNDKASDKLYAIRQKIRKTNSDIKIKLTSYTKSGEMSKYMQESIVTIREGRYVIPVKQEYKGYIQGLVHDQSATGATLFIEPLAIVNLNNELKELEISEKDEMEAILKDFTARISKFSPYLRQNQTTIATLDCIFAKAQYGVKIRAIKPIVNDIGYTNLISARHPLIDKNKVVPISIHFGKENDIVVITGPNTGGKTVSLKTVGLLSILSAVGIFVPAEEHSEISVYDNIFCDIGDEQSIEQSLSTFSSHIRNISDILDNVNNKSLVLIDEIGAGTEPNEGSALAVAITEFLLQSGCKAVVTTHYSQLKEFSLITDKIENASMEFNSKTFEPTYKLILGVPGNSNAIDIASTLGLSKEVISCARGKLSDEVVSFEKVLQNAETIRQQYEVKKSETEEVTRNLKIELDKAHRQNDSLTAEREKLLKNSKTEAKRIINEAQEESKELIEQLKSLVKSGNIEEKELFNARSKVKT
ncbi:MAG: endonuclease MutS2, partial [Clostridia bacterium]